MKPERLRAKIRRLRADEGRLLSDLGVVQARIQLWQGKLDAAIEAERADRERKRAEAERKRQARADHAAEVAARKRERLSKAEARKQRDAAKAQRAREREAFARAKTEAAESARRDREAQEREAVGRIKTLAFRVADAATEHYGTTIRGQSILRKGGTRRVLDARRALIWLGREREQVTLRVLALALDRDESNICAIHGRPMSVEAAAIVRIVLLRDLVVPRAREVWSEVV